MILENNLKVVMWKKRIDQKSLAELTGLSRTTITMIANDNTIPKLDNAYLIAEALGVTVYDIWPIKKPSG